MKKTLLAIALLLGSTCTFAQLGLNKDAIKMEKKAMISNFQRTIIPSNNRTAAKSLKTHPAGTTPLCDFSDATTYTFGRTANHTVGNTYGWQLKADTSSAFSDASWINNYYGISTLGWKYFVNANAGNMTAGNGFAYLYALRPYFENQNVAHGTFDATITINNGIPSYGLGGLDIYFSQLIRKFNGDRYFIDWCNNSSFTAGTYDSIEVNIKGVDVAVNNDLMGVRRINLPNNTLNAHAVGTTPTELTYIRLRYYSPIASGNEDQPHGYWWVVDDISYDSALAENLDVTANHYYDGGYTFIPNGITPDTLIYSASVANTGVDVLTNIKLENKIYQGVYNTTDSLYHFNTEILSNASVAQTLTNTVWIDTDTTTSPYTFTLRRDHSLEANSTPLYSSNLGVYRVINGISYTNQRSLENGFTPLKDTVRVYRVVDSLVANFPHPTYRWAKDNNDLDSRFHGEVWQYGYDGEYITDNDEAWNKQGYKVCSGFQATAVANTLYLKGVELVPGLDSCSAGTRIKASLWKWNDDISADSLTLSNVVKPVTDANGNAIVSATYAVASTDLNTAATAEDFRTIYLPFTDGSVQLKANNIYYACYELMSNGNFAVGKDINYTNASSFGPGNYYKTLIFSQNCGTAGSGNYAWGGRFRHPANCDYVAPMIRFFVSNDPYNPASGINEVSAKAASNLSVYPNPVANNAVLNYTLNQNGNVTITVTDIMGRTVLTMNEGKQVAGVDYRVNVGASSLTNGTYFCTVNVNGAKSTTKLVVNR